MKRRLGDDQVTEFERRDLGGDVRKSKSSRRVTPKARPTSILLSKSLIKELKKKAAKRRIGYQTMLKIILAEQMNRY